MLYIKKVLPLHPQTRNTCDYHNDSVAQLVEHDTLNVGVQGSSPSQVTKTYRLRGEIGRLAILRGWCPFGRAGSNPVVGT